INEGYYMWKWRVPAEAETPGGWSSATVNVNPRWMRLAEVYLLGSEAHLMAGNQGKADEYLNKVRGRAKASLKTGVKLADIQVEKRLELCGEGVRYQDLIRWGIAAEKMKDQGKNCPLLDSNGNIEYKVYNTDANRFGFKEKHNLLPYPGVEIRLNPNIKQNPGW
ncbi:MAG: RagB/SusD family nutrient uptake outer membrane protein, partial [Bacteroidales bacterium]|nr:RagB/SusD family nutrient uptake outer membrane protein [Bacteroidales bacterium]